MGSVNSERFRCCPGCGTEPITWRGGNEIVCPRCGLNFFLNVAAAVGLVCRFGNRILLTRRLRDPAKGLLDLPGGFIDPGETAEEGLRRELREELALEVGRLDYLCSLPNEYPFDGILYHTLDIFFETIFAEQPQVQLLEDIAEVVWMEPARVTPETLAFPSMRRLFREVLG